MRTTSPILAGVAGCSLLDSHETKDGGCNEAHDEPSGQNILTLIKKSVQVIVLMRWYEGAIEGQEEEASDSLSYQRRRQRQRRPQLIRSNEQTSKDLGSKKKAAVGVGPAVYKSSYTTVDRTQY